MSDIQSKFGFYLGLKLGQLEFVWYLNEKEGIRVRKEILKSISDSLNGKVDIFGFDSYRKVYSAIIKLFKKNTFLYDYICLGIYAYRINTYLNVSAGFSKRKKLKSLAVKKLKELSYYKIKIRNFNKYVLKNKLQAEGIFNYFSMKKRNILIVETN